MGKKNDIVLDFLSDSEVFASLFNGYLFDGEQIIQPDDLKEIDGKVQVFLARENKKSRKDTFEVIKRERDIVREVMIGDIPIRLTVLGIEHQSEVDSDIFVKMLPYMGNWPLNVISVYDVGDTANYQGKLKNLFDVLRYVNDGEKMYSFVQEHHEEYSKLDEATRRILSLLTEMEFYIEGDETEEVPEVCKALEDIKKMGETQERAAIVMNMFKKGMSCEDISSLTDISLEMIQEIVGETCSV